MTKKGLKDAFTLAFMLIVIFNLDWFEQIPYIGFIVFLILVYYGSVNLIMQYQNNKKYAGESYYRIKHQNDLSGRISNILFGLLLIGIGVFFYLKLEYGLQGAINFALYGLILLVTGINYKDSIILEFQENNTIKALDKSFVINREDQEVEFRRSQIAVKQKDGETINLKGLILNYEQVDELVVLMYNCLNNSNIKYVRKTENRIETIDLPLLT